MGTSRAMRAVVAGLALLTASCADGARREGADAPPTTTTSEASTTTTAAPAPATAPAGPVELEVTDVVTGLDTVWSMAFDRSGKLWFTQRGGQLQQVGGRTFDVPGVLEQGEGGLMGLEIDGRGRFYLMLTGDSDNRIVRMTKPGAAPEVLVDGIRKAGIHNGGRLRFGPDGTLYAGTGDAGDPSLPQADGNLNGKILTLKGESRRESVFSKGHRNPQGLCFDPSGRLVITDHGPDRGDEVDVVTKGFNGGWPDRVGNGIHNYTPTIAPTGCTFYTGDAIPQWKGSMLFTTLKDRDLRRLTFGADGSVVDEEVLFDGDLGRLRDVIVGPDGFVYLATSNRDSRGDPKPGDDRIVRVAPKGAPPP